MIVVEPTNSDNGLIFEVKINQETIVKWYVLNVRHKVSNSPLPLSTSGKEQ